MSEWSVSASTAAESDAAQMWARELAVEARRPGFWGQFMGTNKNSIIQIKDNFIKQPGDVINFGLKADLSQAPIGGDGWMEDNEEAITTYFDSVKLDRMKHAVRVAGVLSEQRVPYSMREEAKDSLSLWYQETMDEFITKKLSGSTFQAYPGTAAGTKGSLTTYGEAATTNTNIIYGGDATATTDIDTSDTFSLDLIDKAKTIAKTGVNGSTSHYKVNPVMINGKRFYVLVVHPYQIYDLRQTSEWKQVMREAEVRGKENPIFSGATGYYNGCFIYEFDQIVLSTTWGADSLTSGATALFLGAQAGLFARAQKAPDWREKTFNYGEKWGVMTAITCGFDKATYNSLDFATIAIKTAAKNPLA